MTKLDGTEYLTFKCIPDFCAAYCCYAFTAAFLLETFFMLYFKTRPKNDYKWTVTNGKKNLFWRSETIDLITSPKPLPA